jgi:hypothetical protein
VADAVVPAVKQSSRSTENWTLRALGTVTVSHAPGFIRLAARPSARSGLLCVRAFPYSVTVEEVERRTAFAGPDLSVACSCGWETAPG